MARAGIQLAMVRDNQSLFFASSALAAQFDVTAGLIDHREAEALRIEMTSEPESRFSLGIGRFDFHRHDERGIGSQTELRQVLILEK